MGIRYLLRSTGAEQVIIGIEANKQDAADHLSGMIPDDLPVSVQVVPVKYPQGAEKMLITALLGKEVPSGGLPIDVGALSGQCSYYGRDRTSAPPWPRHTGTGGHHHGSRRQKEG
jgi:Na+-translocating ferredoxin:NAD+ oxidoreductase RnfC subunit